MTYILVDQWYLRPRAWKRFLGKYADETVEGIQKRLAETGEIIYVHPDKKVLTPTENIKDL